MDFTMVKYQELCEAILNTRYIPLSVERYLSRFKTNYLPKIILRHDVDLKPECALKMAEVESDFGIKSTYYFRMKKDVFNTEIIEKIADMGHEIGYHYEVLDKAGGNFEKAIRIFEEELEEFRKICNVKTICMHGNPMSKWVNKELWKKYDFRDFGIIGESYLSIDYKNVLYLTDTSRSWDSLKYRVKDIVETREVYHLKSTDDVINLIKGEKEKQMCILAHPARWNDNFGAWVKELAWQNVKNVGKRGLVLYRHVK